MMSVAERLPKPDTSNTAAVIVSYHPDDRFAARLSRLNEQFPAVFWVDNTPEGSDEQKHSPLSRVSYLPQGSNRGLGTALNSGCRAALKAGFKWVVTFDQDSDIADDFLRQQVYFCAESDPSTFVLGCNYSDTGNLDSPRFAAGDLVVKCETVITSGCLMSLIAWSQLGEFRDDYFIDGIDHEICLRGRSKGFAVSRHGRVLMNHRIGERAANYRIFPYLHSPVRKYYSMRNGVRNIMQYATSEPAWAGRKCITLAWEVVIALLFEPERLKKSRAMFRGFRDGVKGRMGPAPNEWFA